MDRRRVLRQRLATQRLGSAPLPRAADAVRLLTCVQSQERDHAFFSLGLRSRSATYAAVRAEYDSGAFLRTHILRPTWHFVLPEDLRWILAATSERVVKSMGGRHAQVGLDDPRFVGRSMDALTELLSDRSFATRPEINAAFEERGGLPAKGEQLGHLLLLAELNGMVCSGPMRGPHHTYALVDEVVPPTPALAREEALARLAHRFFAGHGPASVKDFTRWASLTIADATAAIADVGDALEQVEVDGVPHWFDPEVPRRATPGRAAYLLPVYDEVVLTYPSVNFPAAQGHPNGDECRSVLGVRGRRRDQRGAVEAHALQAVGRRGDAAGTLRDRRAARPGADGGPAAGRLPRARSRLHRGRGHAAPVA